MIRAIIYVFLTYVLTWLVWGLGGTQPVNAGALNTQLVASIGMLCPAACAFLVSIGSSQKLALRPQLRGNLRFYCLAWLGPVIFAIAGSALYFTVFREQFDPNMGYMRELLQALGAGELQADTVAAVQIAASVTIGPFINLFFALGEEIGWRGLLYPALDKYLSPAAACVIGGLIWGVWHVPLTFRGHNYGFDYMGYPITGVLAMCVFCFSLGTLLYWLRLKTGSVWPAALAHGAINAVCGIPFLFLQSSQVNHPLLGPTCPGVLAGVPLLIFAVLCICRMTKCRKESIEAT